MELDPECDFGSGEEAKNEWQVLQPTSHKPAKHLFVNVRQSLQEKSGNEELDFTASRLFLVIKVIDRPMVELYLLRLCLTQKCLRKPLFFYRTS